MNYIGYGHDKPDSTDSEVTAKPTLSAYIVTENLECGTLRDCVLNQVILLIQPRFAASKACAYNVATYSARLQLCFDGYCSGHVQCLKIKAFTLTDTQ